MDSNTAEPLVVTERFILRPLTAHDATARYLGWLADEQARRYIQAASGTRSLDDLRTYITERSGKTDVIFFGIFERASGEHIGNIKYEPIDVASGSAEMGILVGESSWRGFGVAREVIIASACWLRDHRGISRICLGVERKNLRALTAYLHAGFRQTSAIYDPRMDSEVVRMVLETVSPP